MKKLKNNPKDIISLNRAISIFGGITSSNDDKYTDIVVDGNYLEFLISRFHINNEDITLRLLWIMGNISVGSEY